MNYLIQLLLYSFSSCEFIDGIQETEIGRVVDPNYIKAEYFRNKNEMGYSITVERKEPDCACTTVIKNSEKGDDLFLKGDIINIFFLWRF